MFSQCHAHATEDRLRRRVVWCNRFSAVLVAAAGSQCWSGATQVMTVDGSLSGDPKVVEEENTHLVAQELGTRFQL